MEQQRVEALEARLERVERRLRALVVGWVVSLVMVGIVGVLPERATSQDKQTVQAQAVYTNYLTVIGPKGEKRMSFSAGSDWSELLIRRPDGKLGVRIIAGFKETSLTLEDPGGNVWRAP